MFRSPSEGAADFLVVLNEEEDPHLGMLVDGCLVLWCSSDVGNASERLDSRTGQSIDVSLVNTLFQLPKSVPSTVSPS